MDNVQRKRTPWLAVAIVVGLLCLGAFLVARSIVDNRSQVLRTATATSAFAGQSIKAHGDGIIYYDGATLHALNGSARQIWNYAAGVNAGFSVGSGGVATWSGTRLSLLDGGDGSTMFGGDVEDTVLDSRIGTLYAATQIGTEHNSVMLITELSGRVVDRIELKNQTVMDFGFCVGDTLLWVMSLDTEGTLPTCSISTYRPGRTLAGTITDTQQVFYDVVFQSSKIRAVGTTHIKDFLYENKEVTDNRILVYGWYLMGLDDRSNNPLMCFVPIEQSDGSTGVNDLRMIRGQIDQRVRLPFAAINVLVKDDTVYAFSSTLVMVMRLGEQSPTVYNLPIAIDGVIDMTENKSAVVTSGGYVYFVPMP